MENFYRSLRYLKPYRVRIGLAILCVIVMASIWGGGLGLLVPGTKILLDEEGLHGWVFREVAQDRLNVSLSRQSVPEGRAFELTHTPFVLQVTGLHEKDPAPGLRTGDWLIGLTPGQPTSGPAATSGPTSLPDEALAEKPATSQPAALSYETMAEKLARLPEGQVVKLRLFNPTSTPDVRTQTITLGPSKYATRVLADVVSRVPQAHTWAERFPVFVGLLVVVLVLTLVRGFFQFMQEYLVGTAVWRGIMDLRCENYDKVLHMPASFFSEKGANDAMSRFIQDIGELARGQNTLLGKTLAEPFKAIASLCVALWASWQLTLVALIAGPPSYFVLRKLGKSMHRASRRALQSASLMLGVLEETLTGIRVVKAYTMEGSERKRFFRVNRQLLKQQYRMERLDAMIGPLTESLGLIFGLGAVALAGYLVFVGTGPTDHKQRMETSTFILWLGTLFALFDPVRKLAKVGTRFQQADAAAKRIFELHDTPGEVQVHNAPTLPRHSRDIEFRHVSFRYPSASDEAVKDVNLTIQAGQSVAFVGSNGSGKTTLLSLLPRLLDPTAGDVLIDGHSINQYSIRSLRRQIGLVTQDTVIFHASIADNIAYGLRRPKREAVLSASRRAFVDEFVQQMPEGYESLVGEHGSTLSGGQKQRIAIARAILRDPAILIFDEALSQVDPESERKIHQTLAEFSQGRTTLMIAHRLQTVLQADVIAMMEAGRIIDVGTHDQLLQRCPAYSLLFQTQFTKNE